DGDGVGDAAELGDLASPADTDGDGKLDAVESKTADADGDCVPDEVDPADDDPLVPGDACKTFCDGNLGAGEVCDDGNTDARDGCDLCEAAALPVSRAGRISFRGDVAALASGGFVATWSEGRAPGGAAEDQGRSIGFFDANGVLIKRYEGLDPGNVNRFFPKAAAGLRGGDAVLVWSRWDETDGVYHLEAQRFTDDGELVGPLLTLLVGNDFPETRIVARNAGAWAFVHTDAVVGREGVVSMGFVDASGGVLETTVVGTVDAADPLFGAFGLADDTIALVARDVGRGTLVLRRYGVLEAAQIGEDEVAVPADLAPTRFAVAPLATGGGFGVIYLTAGDAPTSIGVRRFDAAGAPAGEPETLVPDLGTPCGTPTTITGGFLVGGEVFAAIGEEICERPIRGWLAASSGVKALPIAAPDRGLAQYTLRAGTYAGGAVFLWLENGGDLDATYVTGFSRQGARTYLSAPPLSD
ncbi:MAG: DUF4215 domain-containing protein, partial [Myxococcales bacterium]|nr:DUF4215 domain-containing protein [Myxococcales bacterium]